MARLAVEAVEALRGPPGGYRAVWESIQNWESRFRMQKEASFSGRLPESRFPSARPASAMATIVEQVYVAVDLLKSPTLAYRCIACMVMLAMQLIHRVHFPDLGTRNFSIFKNL